MKQYVVDAFTDHVFAGNPAAVCVMDKWLDEKTMMAITMENNLSETAFAVKEGEKYHLRWFTPGGEIDLCGHACKGIECSFCIGTAVLAVHAGNVHGIAAAAAGQGFRCRVRCTFMAAADSVGNAQHKGKYKHDTNSDQDNEHHSISSLS